MVFRADASKSIGTGHVMRSTALAEEAICRGISCVFIGDLGNIEWLKERVDNLGFTDVFQDDRHFNSNSKNDILIIDSYIIDPSSKFISTNRWRYIISIADSVTPEYQCDLKIHPGLDESWMADNRFKSLSGPDYILIRKSVKKNVSHKGSVSKRLKLLVAAGGSDPFGLNLKIAEIIDSMDLDITVNFFTNEKILSHSGKKFVNHKFGPDFDKVAEHVDVVISTASTTCLEFIGREIPMGLVSVVENQESYYKEITAKNYALPLGYFDKKIGWNLDKNKIYELLNSDFTRNNLLKNIIGLIDLNGSKRIVSYILSEIKNT